MAIQTKENGAYTDIADVQTPLISGARQQAEAVRVMVAGAWQDVWTAMKKATVTLHDDENGEKIYDAHIVLEDNNLLVTHPLTFYYGDGDGTGLIHRNVTLMCDEVNLTSPLVTFDLSAVVADVDSDVQIYIDYYYSDGSYTWDYAWSWGEAWGQFTSLPADGECIYDEGGQYSTSVQSSPKYSTTIAKIGIRVNSYGYYDDEYDSTGEMISMWLKNIRINGTAYGGSYQYNSMSSLTDVTKFESYHK